MHDLNKPQCNKLLLPFSFLFFLLLVCCPSPLLWFLLFFAEQLLCDISFFVLYLIWNFLSPFTRWKCWKLYFFLMKDGPNGSAFPSFCQFWAHVMWCINCFTSMEAFFFFLFFYYFILSSNFLVFNIKKCTEMTYYINIFLKNVYYQYYYYLEWYFKFEIWHN